MSVVPKLSLRVVSLADSAARRAAVAENLGASGLDWAFFDACRADTPSPLEVDAGAQRDGFGRALTGAEIGCFKSHAAVLAAFDEDPALDWLMVAEDDVWIDTDFPYAELAGFLDAQGIGFLRLFAREWRKAYPRYRFGERQILFLASDPYGTQGYLISRAAAARFGARLRAIRRPIDDEMGRFWENGLDNHLLFPFPLIERHVPATMNAARAGSDRDKPRPSLRRLWAKGADYLAKRAYLGWRLSPLARDRVRPRKR